MALAAPISVSVASACPVRSRDQKQQTNVRYTSVRVKPQKQQTNVRYNSVRVKPLCLHFNHLEGKIIINNSSRVKRASGRCAASLNATCAAEQTQTVTRQSSTITVAPIQGKEKSPELDDGGTGFPPRDDGDGGGGGGGGGGHWSGGFFFFGFLAFLGLLKDKESEGPYESDRRR